MILVERGKRKQSQADMVKRRIKTLTGELYGRGAIEKGLGRVT